jgi:hypothetical protein
MAAPTWNEIKEAGEAADLDMDLWEDELHDRLVSYIIDRTKSTERYLYDAEFHAQIERLVGLVIGCISEHSPLVDPILRQRAAEFDDLFAGGAQEGRDARPR